MSIGTMIGRDAVARLGGSTGSTATTSGTTTTSKTTGDRSFTGIVDSLTGLVGAGAGLVGAIKTGGASAAPEPVAAQPKKDNTILYLGLAAVALVIIMLVAKKK